MPFPFIDINTTQKVDTIQRSLPMFREFEWDISTNEYVVRDGKINIVEGAEALKIWIYKCLKTVRGKYFAYTWNYGHDLESLIETTSRRDVLTSEAKRLIKEALTVNPYITDCIDFSFKFEGNKMSVEFTAVTVYSNISIQA